MIYLMNYIPMETINLYWSDGVIASFQQEEITINEVIHLVTEMKGKLYTQQYRGLKRCVTSIISNEQKALEIEKELGVSDYLPCGSITIESLEDDDIIIVYKTDFVTREKKWLKITKK